MVGMRVGEVVTGAMVGCIRGVDVGPGVGSECAAVHVDAMANTLDVGEAVWAW